MPLRTLVARAGGNPFFLEELAWHTRDQDPLATPEAVPDTVHAVVAARLDRLPPAVKRLAQTAAVIGMEVPWSLLQALADEPKDRLQQGLAHLQAAEFLSETTLFPESAYTFKHVLTQEVTYNAVLLERRRVLHERAAQAIERLFAARLPEHYPALAHHYTRSGNTARAVDYLHRAGHQALERSAYAEAISHLTTALDLLRTLPESRARSQQELVVQLTLGPALMATTGRGAPAMERLYMRARALYEQVEEGPDGPAPTQSRQPMQLCRVLWGLQGVYGARGAYQQERAVGEALLNLAQRLQHPDLLLEAHHALWSTLFFGGELVAARCHQTQGLRLYDPQRHRAHAALYSGHDPGVCGGMHAGLCLWLLGYPDQALASMQAALALAQQLAHPYSLTFALHWAAMLHQVRREAPLVQAHAEAAMTLATEQEFRELLARTTPLRGWALAAGGHAEEGRAQLQQGIAAYRATGMTGFRAYSLALLAEVCGQLGHTSEGLAALAEALATLTAGGHRWWAAELYRLRGELLLHAGAQPGEAEACVQQALAVARRQQAKSLELRAATSLSRLWQQQGKCAEAYDLLAPIYDWFTEGFDMADLQEAKALLAALSSGPCSSIPRGGEGCPG